MAELTMMVRAALCFGVIGTVLSALALALYWRRH
jgi:hypothetical protein